MIDAANFEEGTLWDPAGLQSRVRVDPSITYVEASVTRTITQEYALFGWRGRTEVGGKKKTEPDRTRSIIRKIGVRLKNNKFYLRLGSVNYGDAFFLLPSTLSGKSFQMRECLFCVTLVKKNKK